jgi:hypothetical protein
MSNALAIASVTAVLRNLLDNAMIKRSVNNILNKPIRVYVSSPDYITTGGQEDAQLNLFLYRVAPNPGWRNAGLPSNDQRGNRISNPPLALDLYYLLTAYGKDLEAEILLGYAMQLIHEMPVLTRKAIQETLTDSTVVDGSLLPSPLNSLQASELADQVELIKITLEPMNIDEMSKIWTAFHASYRPSVTYRASVVLIESRHPVFSPLPVLTRGEPDKKSGRDKGITVEPSMLPSVPTLTEVVPPRLQPAVRMGEILKLKGHHLMGGKILIRFTHLISRSSLEIPALSQDENQIEVRLPIDSPIGPVFPDSPLNPANWRAGVYSVSALIVCPGHDLPVMTNELPVALAPKIVSYSGSNLIDIALTGNEYELKVKCSPRVRKNQRASLILGVFEIRAEPLDTTVDASEVLTFRCSEDELPRGEQWLRLRVEGVESILIDRTKSPPSFEDSWRLTL